MRDYDSHDHNNAQAPEELGIQLVKGKCKENIDQGKAPPPDQLKKPVLHPFFLHRPAKLVNPLPAEPLNIPVANWYYKWDVWAILHFQIIDLAQLSAFSQIPDP